MPRVIFTQAARDDIAEAMSWYVARAPYIVPQLRQALRSVVERIEDNPKQFLSSSQGARRALLKRFPYVVVFRETTEACVVVAVFHMSRDPRVRETR